MIAGVDEAGRGALAGPVVASAVILDPRLDKSIFMDSKQCTELKRETLYNILFQSKSSISIAVVGVKYIDQYNILNATLAAMKDAILKLPVIPQKVLVDGNKIPDTNNTYSIEAIIKGDQKVPEIAAASIVAKVYRDQLMMFLADRFKQYKFDIHKGYATALHKELIYQNGRCIAHRRSFNTTFQPSLF